MINFSDIIQQKGLAQAIEDSAAQILHEDAISSILRSFQTVGAYIQDALDGNKTQIVQIGGVNYKRLNLPNGDYQIYSLDGKNLAEVKKGNLIMKGVFGKGPNGEWGLISGTIREINSQNNTYTSQFLTDGFLEHIEVGEILNGQDSVEYLIKKIDGESSINFNTDKTIRDADIEGIKDQFSVRVRDGYFDQIDNTYYIAPPSYLIGQGFASDDVVEITTQLSRDPVTGKYRGTITPGPIRKNYAISSQVGKYDVFANTNLQIGNDVTDAFVSIANTASNAAGYLFNLAFNLSGYVNEGVDYVTGTTVEERAAWAMSTPVPFDDLAVLGLSAIDRTGNFLRAFQGINEVVNPLPGRFARVVSLEHLNDIESGVLQIGRADNDGRIFVVAADDIAGISTPEELAKRLTLLNESGQLNVKSYAIIEFNLDDVTNLTFPVFRSNPGFISGGYTLGGAREYTMANKYLSELSGYSIRIVESSSP